MKAKPSRPAVAPGPEILAPLPAGAFVELEGEVYYRISGYDRLDPFLMTIPGDTDQWMFVTSGGGLSAGRVDPDGSLFPYLTVDQLHDAHHHTGPVTLIQVDRADGQRMTWEPFVPTDPLPPAIERNLYKNAIGNRVVFEEVHRGLGIAFRYRWAGSDEFGWVRTGTLENLGRLPARITFLDGLRNVLPYGVPLSLYQQASTLVDAYKKTDLDPESRLGIFSLTSRITDRAEALEVLRANSVWCCGLEDFEVHLPLATLTAFRAGTALPQDRVLEGTRGNYLVSSVLELAPQETTRWHIVADAGLDHVRIARLRQDLLEKENLEDEVEESLRRASENLRRNVGSADGLQLTNHAESWTHHFANVLFNNMRGGVFLRHYDVPMADFADFVRQRHAAVADRRRDSLAELGTTSTVQEVRATARRSEDVDFERLSYEYLPLYFGRRHGDPSRPWNRFSIRTRNGLGELELNYQGNWRDIFQNWEALAMAFPGYLPSMVAKFVNASTVDGFNPYRITRSGVDWEVLSPEDPWSNIGYWGDHQIIYLLKLLEALDRYDPTAIDDMLGREIFSYAEVPYRIKPYEDILADPRSSIDYDAELDARIEERVAKRGTDGKLLTGQDGSVYHVNLLEKLLVPVLSKLSNLVPDAGIWMNTQRPEWNDANNALAGGAASVVTLCHLRRHLAFLAGRLSALEDRQLAVSREVAEWFEAVAAVLDREKGLLSTDQLASHDRKRLLDELGGAFSAYRQVVYPAGFSGKTDLALSRVVDLFRTALDFIEWGIAANRRSDGLFHTYNVLHLEDETRIEVVPLQEMLEGQVAALSSGFLEPEAALDLLERLFQSALYRRSQRSFMLYPQKELPDFLERNVVPESGVRAIPLLTDLLESGDHSLLARDVGGTYRFHGDLRNSSDLAAVLDALEENERWRDAVRRDRPAVLELFEEVFRHRSYTGRSGVMFGYEGIGCIYWHMVAKLLLAVQENVHRARDENRPPSVQRDLARMYFRVRAGIGYEKSVTEYGAFPTDPYSHTPKNGGAKQPGMTGQVKEEILTRAGELGIRVEKGRVHFQPGLLRTNEFLRRPAKFCYFDVQGQEQSMSVPAGSLVFTLCQVPVVYERVAGGPSIHVTFTDGSSGNQAGNALDAELSAALFSRDGRIERIHVGVPERDLDPL